MIDLESWMTMFLKILDLPMMHSFYTTNAYDGHDGLMLREQFPTTLESAQYWASNIEESMLSTKIDCYVLQEYPLQKLIPILESPTPLIPPLIPSLH